MYHKKTTQRCQDAENLLQHVILTVTAIRLRRKRSGRSICQLHFPTQRRPKSTVPWIYQ